MDVTAIPDDTYVCRCEEIRAMEIRQAINEGATTINDVKRRTRAGMGVCQGIYCTRSIANLIASGSDTTLDVIEPMTARPPARLVSLARIAAAEEQG